MRIYDSILDTIGRTPLVRLSSRSTREIAGEILAKLEVANPGGSVKDRIGLRMIEEAERRGAIRPGGTIVEATSGNTGVGLAIAAATKGYRVLFAIPDKMAQEKVNLLKAYGAKVIVTPTAVAPEDPRHYTQVAARLAREIPNAVFVNQYGNPENPRAHYETTGPEIWEACEGSLRAFVAGAGTGGTITGAGRFLKERDPTIRVVAVDPEGSIYAEYFRTGRVGPHHTYKVEGIGEDTLPETMDFSVVDEVITVSDRDAFLAARRLARTEGIFAGGSTGAALVAALKEGKRLKAGERLVVLFADTGERYLSKLYNDAWMQENQFREAIPDLTALDLLGAKREAPALVVVGPDAPASEAISLMKRHEVSQVPVVEEGEVVGSVREDLALDLLTERRDADAVRVREIMGPPLPVASPDAGADELSRLFRKGHPAVLVRLGNEAFGILTKFDLLQAIAP